MNKPKTDLCGQKFGKLTVISLTNKRHNKKGTVWECLCECGNIKLANTSGLNSGANKSCGCITTRKDPRSSNYNKIYLDYLGSARRRGYTFNLTKEQFKEFLHKNCYYCGNEPSQIIRSSNKDISKEWKDICQFSFNGIDRVNNDVGYELNNCVTCCNTCNKMKMDNNQNDFLIQIKRIFERHCK